MPTYNESSNNQKELQNQADAFCKQTQFKNTYTANIKSVSVVCIAISWLTFSQIFYLLVHCTVQYSELIVYHNEDQRYYQDT